ncbi:codanin-1 isoform X2 [Cephus cinctus]|uniref:Codanin-1 isoform X2 n=1 Tax=Cephus cinctus TaxID=211228 RepID=A0AAJ7RPM9_CEPCN|nr:codanin-1 isoform X2 [Cephus cinctus]
MTMLSVPQASNNAKQTSASKNLSKINERYVIPEIRGRRVPRSIVKHQPLESKIFQNDVNTIKPQIQKDISKSEQNILSHKSCSDGTQKIISQRYIFENSHLETVNLGTHNIPIANYTSTQTSTPIIKCSSPISDTSFINQSKDELSNCKISLTSDNCSTSQLNDSFFFNTSVKSQNSSRNESYLHNNSLLPIEIHQSPISPIYNNHISSKPPKNVTKSHNKYPPQQVNNVTPQHKKNAPSQQNSSQKNSKTTPRHTICLGDFLATESNSSKKDSIKKSNSKIQLLRQSREENQLPSRPAVTDESFPEVGASSARKQRRIKPTRLDKSEDTSGNQTNWVFGVVNRPVKVNPQFIETLPTDNSANKSSFDVERDLLRLERKRQTKSLSAIESNDSVIQQPQPKIRMSTKASVNTEYIMPNVELVEYIDVLDILAQLYSSLLDYNLVVNPMTELYFIISLITMSCSVGNNQFSNRTTETNVEQDRSKITIDDINESIDANMLTSRVENEDDSDGNEKVNFSSIIDESEQLDDLNEELGCAVLTDDISPQTEQDNVLSTCNDEKLKESNVVDGSGLDYELEQEMDNNELTKYLQTKHNRVYFSTRVLNSQRVLLKNLDRTTLKLLSENIQIGTFQPELQAFLKEFYNIKFAEANRIKQIFNFSTMETNVCFQIDTDNRDNFPSILAFHSFKKQRDMFYEILRSWEENHLVPSWTLASALGGKVKTLLTLHNDAINYSHFARLFKSQLLISCIRNGHQEKSIDEESLSVLKSLKQLNPEKLTQLQERLVTPTFSQGPVPLPSFPGVQEFFKDFLLLTFNPIFYVHLENCLVHEILELNDTQFIGSDIEDTETMVDEETKQNFITCLSSLRLLAKILGFLLSLPYRTETVATEGIIASQIEIRSRVQPSLNLQACIINAVVERKLSLTIPWAVKYLAMLEPISLRLPYYQEILELLYYIYRGFNPANNFLSRNSISQQTVTLVKFAIGWLFELPNFPKDLYCLWQSSYNNRRLKVLCQIGKLDWQDPNVFSTDTKKSASPVKSNLNLDHLEIVDDRVLYICCPFLMELKILLTSGNAKLTSNNPIKHITPVSSELDKPIGSTNNTQNLELQLEEAFFHGQPASTRKTVDFVAERVASSCVKYVCNILLPPAREKNLNEFKKIVDDVQLACDQSVKRKIVQNSQIELTERMNSMAENLCKELRDQCEKSVPSMIESRSVASINALLAEDALASVKEMCAQITVRMAMERVNQWIQSHLVNSLFVKDMEPELGRFAKSSSAIEPFEKRNHNPAATSPIDVLDEIRDLIWDLVDNEGESLALEIVSISLNRLYESLTERGDLLPGPERVICALSVDFALFLIAYRTDLCVPNIYDMFIKVWKIDYVQITDSNPSLKRLLSPRNILLLAQPNKEHVWTAFGQFLRKLLKENLLDIDCLSDQAVALFREVWPVPTLKNLSKCLSESITDYKSLDEQTERIKCLLVWVAETCQDMELRDE